MHAPCRCTRTIEVSIICTAASWAPANALMILAHLPPVASEQTDCSRSCTDRSYPADRAMEPGSQHPEDAIEDAAVIHSWHAARLAGQHRLDGSPFVVGEF